jgi:thioredoxin-related protein
MESMMKHLCLIFFVFALGSATEWRSYEQALKEQQVTHKIIMIDVVRTNCHYCNDMEAVVFQDKEMTKWIEKRFIPVKVNMDNEKLPLGLSVSFTPTFIFVDEKHAIIKKIPGSWNIEDFRDLTKGIK